MAVTTRKDSTAVKNARYRAAQEYIEGIGKDTTWNYGIRVVSLDPTVGNVGSSTVLSIVLTFGPMYLESYVQVCLANSAKSCAESTFANLDKEASS
jgi:hypothetical protein